MGRFEPGFNRQLGFDGITIALLAKVSARGGRSSPRCSSAGCGPSGTALQSDAKVAPEIVDAVLGVGVAVGRRADDHPLVFRLAVRPGADELQLTTGWGS